jgi:import receptor subunit TOM22
MSEITVAGSSGAAAPKPGMTYTRMFRKLLLHTGKAAWIFGTTMIVVALPLIIEMDREQQLMEMENQQMGVLSGGAPAAAAPTSA